MKNLTLLFVLMAQLAQAQVDLSYYFNDVSNFDPAIPTPEEVLGYQVGEWHVNHDQLSKYMNVLAEKSPRVSIEEYGKSYEDRALWLVKFTSAANQARLEDIRLEHVALTNGERKSTNDLPVIVWMGYSVHGNESSGTNAALLMAYYLAAAQSPKVEQQLAESVILMDPMINPDGNMRFSTWVNSHKGKNLAIDPQNIEQNEMWPGGRTNHYWFDLNRDWLLLQHPESQGRIQQLQRWKPNVVTDHHEMGRNATFFFQPGIPSRNNPLTPQNTFDLTYKIAQYHIKSLDDIGSLYYSKESFDDFYYGKGSTYPDVNGGVGILFEQASSRAHAQESVNGTLYFPFTIKNQLATSISTLDASHALKDELLSHMNEFYSSASNLASKDKVKTISIEPKSDLKSMYHMLDVIHQHDIDIFKGQKAHSFQIPVNQPQYRLIKALFEERTTFKDSLFYDVSAWTFQHAYNVNVSESTSSLSSSELVTDFAVPKGQRIGGMATNYAYAFKWNEYLAPKALYAIQKAGFRTKVATRPFTTMDGQSFSYGTIVIPVGNLTMPDKNRLNALLNDITTDGIDVYALGSGESATGPYLGSNTFSSLNQPKIAMIIEGGVSSYESGEVWHLLDQRMDMDITMLRMNAIDRVDLSRYNTLVLVNGNYRSISEDGRESLKAWVRNGGNIVATKSAVRWLASNEFTKVEFVSPPRGTDKRPYAEVSPYFGAQFIGGAIFETTLDVSHPVAYGYTDSSLPVFRNSTTFLKPQSGIAANPVMYNQQPLLAGYISPKNESSLAGSAAVTVSSLGRGRIISMVDNPNFRAYWLGTNKLFLNSIFFASTINGNSLR